MCLLVIDMYCFIKSLLNYFAEFLIFKFEINSTEI